MLGSLILATVVGYLLGAVPNGYLLAKLIGGVDVRRHGSGKTGASNVRSHLGWRRGFFPVLALDAAKGAAAVLLAGYTADGANPWLRVAGGLAAMIGHAWPVYLGFQGGRGVATGMGALLVLLPQVALLAAVLAAPLIPIFRYISLASIAGATLIPLLALLDVLLFEQPWPYFTFALAASIMVIAWHKDNIARLRAGTERTI